jgi:hypothetical protein
MANGLTVLSGTLAAEYVHARDSQAGAIRASRTPSLAQLRAALDSLGWSHDVAGWDGAWWLSRTGRDPAVDADPELDFQELVLDDGHYGFRLGPHKGPFEIIRAVARTCGPQVVVEHTGGRAVIVTADTTYEQFVSGMQ